MLLKHHERKLINALGSAAAAGSSFLAAAAKATQGAQASISGITVSQHWFKLSIEPL